MTGKIYLDGLIGGDITTKTVRENIAQYPGATEWDVHINSPGGDVYEGQAIGNIIANLPAPSIARIEALCASIASYCAMCCTKVVMNPAGDFMIHLPMVEPSGPQTSNELRKSADQLDRIKNELISKYMSKVGAKGVTREQLSAMLETETSMSPQEAYKLGFVDEIKEKMKAVATADPKKFTIMDPNKKTGLEEAFSKFSEKVDKIFNKIFKNQVQIALADGTMITSDAADVNSLQDSKVFGPDGQPLAGGDYETADGYQITVAGGQITQYQPLMSDEKTDVAALQKTIADLQAQLAAKNTEAQAVKIETEKVTAETHKQFTALKGELEELRKKTLGDTTPPKVVSRTPDSTDDEENFDPMAELGESFISSRFRRKA